jgi:Ala-tRNA(Pro) deacylase
MKTPQDLYTYFASLDISTRVYEHEPLYTCEQAEKHISTMPGGHTKNLFLKDDKKNIWLISALATTQIELKKVAQLLSAPKLRFAGPELLMEHLGVLPGSVTPFGLINDTQNRVKCVLDKALFDYELLNFHPLVNTATVAITLHDFKRFIRSLRDQVYVIDFAHNALVIENR